jgi:hypothetical protein
MFEVEIRIWLQPFSVEAGQIERFKVDFDGFDFALQPSWNYFGIKEVWEQLVDMVGEFFICIGKISDEGLVDEPEVKVREVTH